MRTRRNGSVVIVRSAEGSGNYSSGRLMVYLRDLGPTIAAVLTLVVTGALGLYTYWYSERQAAATIADLRQKAIEGLQEADGRKVEVAAITFAAHGNEALRLLPMLLGWNDTFMRRGALRGTERRTRVGSSNPAT